MEKTQKITFKQDSPVELGKQLFRIYGVAHIGNILECNKIGENQYVIVAEIEGFDFPDKKVAISSRGEK